jgi:hypothetical protein
MHKSSVKHLVLHPEKILVPRGKPKKVGETPPPTLRIDFSHALFKKASIPQGMLGE